MLKVESHSLKRMTKPLDYREVLLRRAEQHNSATPQQPEVMSYMQYRNRLNLQAWRRKIGVA